MTFILDAASVIKSVLNSSTNPVGGITTLNGSINSSQTTITLADSTQFPISGTVLIDSEYISYSNKSTNDLTGCIRGAFGSTATTHNASTNVTGIFVGQSELNAQPNVATSLLSSTNGIEYYQFSNDGTTWGQFPTNGYTVTSNISEFQTAVKLLRYFRVLFINGSTLQSTFSVYTYYGQFGQPQIALNQAINSDATTIITRSINTGQNPSGSYDNFRGDGYAFQTTTPLSSTTLNENLTNSDTTITLTDATGFTSSGVISIESELIQYTGKSSNDLTGCTRGYNGTTATSHVIGTVVSQVYLSNIFNISGYTQIQAELLSDQSGTLMGQWYTTDAGGTVIRTFIRPYNSTDGYVYLSSPVFGPYLQYTFINGSTSQTTFYLGLKFITKSISGQIVNLDDYISSNMVANLGRNILVGQTNSGQFLNVPVNQGGELKVGITTPTLPFGSVHTENISPLLKGQAIYGIDPLLNNTICISLTNGNSNGSGTVGTVNNMYYVSSGTTTNSLARFLSKQIAQYSPGQGLIARYTALYSSNIDGTTQFVGISNGQDSFGFGYYQNSFGIFMNTYGVRPVWTLTITSTATSGGTVTITLNGVQYSAIVTLSNANQNSWEISYAKDISGNSIYIGWDAIQIGNTVQFTYSISSSTTTATFNAGTTGMVASFANTIVGTSIGINFVSQSNFNGDKLNGTGPSGFNIIPTYGNVYQISLQYLGFGVIYFMVETSYAGSEPQYTIAHTFLVPNSLTKPSMSIPSFYFILSSLNGNSSQSITTYCASYGIFLEGIKTYYGNRFTHSMYLTFSGGGGFQTNPNISYLYSIRNSMVVNNKVNFINITCTSINIVTKGSAVITLYLVKNATLLPTQNFNTFSTNSVALVSNITNGATTSVITTMGTITQNINNTLASYVLQDGSSINIEFDDPIIIYPGEILTIGAAQTSGSSATSFSFSLNTREDR